jgi:hypothetical protein
LGVILSQAFHAIFTFDISLFNALCQ